MSRKPDQIVFRCERCGSSTKPKQVRNWEGRCPGCKRDTLWTVAVFYIDTEVQQSPLSFIASWFVGIGWWNTVDHTNAITVKEVPTDVAKFLTQDARAAPERISQYIRLRQNQELQKSGAIKCQKCDATFVPAAQPWHQSGFCSRVCATKAGGLSDSPHQSSNTVVGAADGTLVVECPNGHRFDVLTSFSGCARPCPTCKARTIVP